MLCFLVAVQIASIVAITKGVKLYFNTRKGTYVFGKVIEVRKILSSREAGDNYEGIVEFNWPDENERYLIKHNFSSLIEPEIGKEYKIWVDCEKPLNSVIVDTFKAGWWYSLFVFIILFLAIFYIDFIYIKRLLH